MAKLLFDIRVKSRPHERQTEKIKNEAGGRKSAITIMKNAFISPEQIIRIRDRIYRHGGDNIRVYAFIKWVLYRRSNGQMICLSKLQDYLVCFGIRV